jgi:uncharacterized membrane protein
MRKEIMADPIGYLVQNIVHPKFDVMILMVAIIGLVLCVFEIITNFFKNKKLRTIFFDIQEKIKKFIDNRKIKAV